jgi:glucose-1-phosphate thymidylyltransferase
LPGVEAGKGQPAYVRTYNGIRPAGQEEEPILKIMRSAERRIAANDLVGVIPAAGLATRLSPLPCSKELYPLGLSDASGRNPVRPKAAGHYLLEKMRLGGVTKAYVVLRKQKWDIPGYWGDGSGLGMNLAYLVLDTSPGVPFTIDHAYPFVQHATIAFGFPDILFDPQDAFLQLIASHHSSNAEVTLGLFPVHRPENVDMVDIDSRGRVRQIVIQPSATPLRHSWAIAVWTPVFTQFLHENVASLRERAEARPEVSVGQVFQLALEAGLNVNSAIVSRSPYVDIGTPEGLISAMRLAMSSEGSHLAKPSSDCSGVL